MALGVKNASGHTVVVTIFRHLSRTKTHFIVFTDTVAEAQQIETDPAALEWAGGATMPDGKWTTIDFINGHFSIFDFVGLRFAVRHAPDGTAFLVVNSAASARPN